MESSLTDPFVLERALLALSDDEWGRVHFDFAVGRASSTGVVGGLSGDPEFDAWAERNIFGGEDG